MIAASTLTVLHLGAGRTSIAADYPNAKIVSLDADYRLEPEVVCELGVDSINLDDNTIDIVHASHVLEHIGKQGETAGWFQFWEEVYRVLKPNGLLHFWAPLYSSVWAWADPSHTRALSPESFIFLDQNSYRQVGSAISPFRVLCDFESVSAYVSLPDVNPGVVAREGVSHFSGTLKARKPLQPWWEA